MRNHFWTPAKRHTSRGYPGQQHMTKKPHQIALKVSKNWPSFWLCPRKFQRNYLGLGSLVGLGSFAVRPGSCPFFRQIKKKGITLSFNWGWSFTNSGLGLDSGSQILWCRGPTDDMIHDKLSLNTLILDAKSTFWFWNAKHKPIAVFAWMNFEQCLGFRIGKMGPASASHHTGPSLEL